MIANLHCFFQEGLGRVGVERGEAKETLCGFRELLRWGHVKLLKAMSGVWAPCMCLLLTSRPGLCFVPGLLESNLLLRFGCRKAEVRTEGLPTVPHPNLLSPSEMCLCLPRTWFLL